jgi:hypothetical protein
VPPSRFRDRVPPDAAIVLAAAFHPTILLFQFETPIMDDERPNQAAPQDLAGQDREPAKTSQCIDWYAEGESRIVEIDGVQMEVRYVGRKGRRSRIAVTAPSGAVFHPG